MYVSSLLRVSLNTVYACVLLVTLCHDMASDQGTTQAATTSSNSSSVQNLTTPTVVSNSVVNGNSPSAGSTVISTTASQNLGVSNSTLSTPWLPLSNSSCRIGVLAPRSLPPYGLVDTATFNATLDSATSEAGRVLSSTCVVVVHVIRTRCTLRATLQAAFTHSFDVLIGPPCSAPANVISLLDKPVITWVPLLVDLGFKFEQETRDAQSESDFAVSSFGTYDDLADSVILTLTHFRWSKIAVVYSQDEFCAGFHGVVTGLLGDNSITAHHLGFDQRNSSALTMALDKARAQARIIVTCTNPDVFEDLLKSAERLSMTSGYYVIVHVKIGGLPVTGGMKSDYFCKLTRSVLFIGHFTAQPTRSERAVRSLSSGYEGQFLDYFYDAILLWAAGRNRTLAGQTPRLNNLTVTGRTGEIHLNDQGVRRRNHSVAHYQGGQLVLIAEIADGYREVRSVEWPGGSLPTDQLQTPDGGISSAQVVGGVFGTLFALLLMLVAALLFRRWRQDRLARGLAWQVEDRDVKRRQTHTLSQNGGNPQRRLVRMETRGTLGLGSICSLDRNQLFAPVGNYRGTVVAVKTIQNKSFRLSAQLITDFNILKELSHDNLNTFVGAHVEPGNSYVLFKYCAKGSLQDVLENEDITLDWMFKMSFATDLARGMEYLHKSALKSHGNLKSSNCVIDSRWVLKVTDFGAVTPPGDDHDDGISNHAMCNALLWTAPELLRLDSRPVKGTQHGDVFSFAIVLQEILFRVGPYGCNSNTPEEIVEKLKKGEIPPFRPHIPQDDEVPEKALTLMTSCWDESPVQRPEFRSVRKRLIELNGGKKVSMLDNMLSLMETYSSRLEQLVVDRTAELAQEKAKTDRLLYQMLPPSVAEQLKSGRAVVPEFYDAVSIFFSDIVGFTSIASQSKPLEVVDLLNDLYTAFDDVIFRRDVYKVETIGDAYMCVSGCPRRNGRRHSLEIAEMALDLTSTVTGVKVRHRPSEALQLRIGLHTGPCAAGVVGVAMPRYCLFGDTVNMASRMESTGKALHVHISSEMQAALEELNCGFMTLERGMIQVKGKGIHKTFWLVGRDGYTKPLPETFSKLRQALDDVTSRPPSPSNASLTVGDGMYSALRKTSLAVSHATVTSDSDDGSTFLPGSLRSESGVDTTFPMSRKHRSSNDTCVSLPPIARHHDVTDTCGSLPPIARHHDVTDTCGSLPPIARHHDVTDDSGDARNKHVTVKGSDQRQQSAIPRIEIS